MIESDICIIGAGPAGAAASLTLSKMKIPHVIIDAAVFPRDKVCGDGLDTTVMRVLNSIESGSVKNEILNDPNFIKSDSFLFHINKSKKKVFKILPENQLLNYPIFCFCKRSYFDNYLIKKINPTYAHFLQGVKVEEIIHKNSIKLIHAIRDGKKIQIKAKVIIGADGRNSSVLKSLGTNKIDKNNYAGALRQYWKGVTDLKEDTFELYFPNSLSFGYLWIFPLPNGEANVGFGLQSSLIAKKNIDLKKMMADIIQNDPVISKRFLNASPLESMKGCGLPFASLKRKLYGDGWLLTGDAGSLICPTTGEGIGPAMLSGYIAAHFIQRAILKNDYSESVFKNYDREIYKRMNKDIMYYDLHMKTSLRFYNRIINCIMSFPLLKGKINKYFERKIELAYTEKIPVYLD